VKLRIGKLVLAACILFLSWIPTVQVPCLIPGTPQYRTPERVQALATKTNEAFRQWSENAHACLVWESILVPLSGGLIVGLCSRLFLRLKLADIPVLGVASLLPEIYRYRPCCITVWEIVQPIILVSVLWVSGFAWTRRPVPPPPNMAAEPDGHARHQVP